MRWWILALGAVVLASCAAQPSPTGSSTTTPTGAVPTTTVASDDTCRSGDLPFTDAGLVAAIGEEEGDASTITRVRWDDATTCERVTIVFASDSGAPAGSLGETAVLLLPTAGVVRIELPPEVSATATADLLPEGDLIHRIFVVREEDGRIFVDLHGLRGKRIAARAFVTDAPSTLVVDVIAAPEGVPPVGTRVSETAVLVDPSPGTTLYPITIDAYAAPGLEKIDVQLISNGVPDPDRRISLPAWRDAWQRVPLTIDDGPTGAIDLFVGTVDSAGNAATGATVRLDVP